MSWILVNNHIAIQTENGVVHLSARDVYSALKNNGIVLSGTKFPSPEVELPDIYFSSWNSTATISIEQERETITISIMASGVPVDFVNGRIVDHIVVENEWFYISNAEDINGLLSNLNIQGNGIITISQYIELLRRDWDGRAICNNVNPEALKTKLTYSKPAGLRANLYEYQKDGYSWISAMLCNNHGCILGDEMGLGKTLQAIAVIQDHSNKGLKTLVIAPVSLLENWANEIRKFAPGLQVLIHHGANRTGNPTVLSKADVIVTSYGNAVTDNLLFGTKVWDLLILDEAQNIKNPKSERAKRVKDIPATEKLAITGTPFENHLLDIWSLMDFIMPGFLQDEHTFQRSITDDVIGASKIEPILTSVMIRRLVADVAQELPAKVIIPQPILMPASDVEVYDQIRKELMPRSEKYTLPMLQKLRMFCTHPMIVDDSLRGDPAEYSSKYQRACEILEEIISKKEKAIVVTSYQKMFDIFMEDLPLRFGVAVNFINGNTKVEDRQSIVDWFNNYNGSAVLIINPRAAGVGLNITGANHVIHYNLEWNPSIEDQATARAFRRGQDKTVFVYRLYYPDTVEEIIKERIERKREMATNAVIGVDGTISDMEDIIMAFNKTPKR